MTTDARLEPQERRLFATLRTPEHVQRWLRGLSYNWRATCYSFRSVARHRSAHCLEGAIAAAALLERRDLPPLLMSLSSDDLLDHVLYVFRRDGRWGAVARSRDLGLHGRKPVFRSVRELAWSYHDPYIDATGRLNGYGLVDLRDLGGYDWRFSSRNVWKVERALQDVPHTRLRGSDARYRKWRALYLDFRARDPDGPVTHFPDRDRWMI